MPRDFWIGIVTLGFATLYWLEAGKIRVSPLDGPVGASGLPNTLAYALGALSVALILRALLAHFRPAKGEVAAVEAPPLTERMRPHFRAIGMLTLGILYLLALPYIGYFLAIMALLMVVSLYIGADLNLRTALVAILGAISFHVLFVEFLDIPLPKGLLIDAVLSAGTSSGNS
jgi:putative tricarboxylic transport membrane protein